VRSRKLRWVVVVGLVVLAGLGAFVLWPRLNRVTRENFARIHPGMTRAEVEAILGPCHAFGIRPEGGYARRWFSAEDPPQLFDVQFDASGAVEETFAGRAKESRWKIGWLRAISRAKHVAGL
jgi:hypothetical protein